MNIFSVKVDVNNYQWLMPQVDERKLLNYTVFDCKRRLDNWEQNEWYSFNPNSLEGNFYSIGVSGAFAFDESVYQSDLFALLEMSGEILPIKLLNRELYIINVLECVNMLNENSTEWDIYDDGSKGRILNYSFHAD